MFDVGGKEEEMLICLQQEDRRIQRKEGGGENLPIGFEVLKVRSSWINISITQTFKSYFFAALSSTGGGEPLQPGAVCSGAGSQLRLHGLPQCYTERNSGSGPLCGTDHYFPARSHGALFATTLLPFPRST